MSLHPVRPYVRKANSVQNENWFRNTFRNVFLRSGRGFVQMFGISRIFSQSCGRGWSRNQKTVRDHFFPLLSSVSAESRNSTTFGGDVYREVNRSGPQSFLVTLHCAPCYASAIASFIQYLCRLLRCYASSHTAVYARRTVIFGVIDWLNCPSDYLRRSCVNLRRWVLHFGDTTLPYSEARLTRSK